MNRALTPAEAVGITGTEAGLTAADRERVVLAAYSGWRADLALAGDPAVRTADWGCGDGDLFCMADNRGLWARLAGPDPHAGHIPWAAAEAILRDARQGEQNALFPLEVSN